MFEILKLIVLLFSLQVFYDISEDATSWVREQINGSGSSPTANRTGGELNLAATATCAGGSPGIRRGSARRANERDDDGEADGGRGSGCVGRNRLLDLWLLRRCSGGIREAHRTS